MSENSMEADYQEKRNFERVTGLFKVVFRELSDDLFKHLLEAGDYEENPIQEAGDEEPIEGKTTDVSQGGLGLCGDLRLTGNRLLKIGTRLLVECYLPNHEIPVRALATVVWVKPGQTPEAGIMFMGIGDQDLRKIRQAIEANHKDI